MVGAWLKVESHAKNERKLGYVRAATQPARTPNTINNEHVSSL